MNRQMKRRMSKNLNLKNQDIDNLAKHFRRENEERERVIVMQFLLDCGGFEIGVWLWADKD